MYLCTYAYMYDFVVMYICVSMYGYVCTYICRYRYLCVCVCVCVCVCEHLDHCTQCACVYKCLYMCVCVRNHAGSKTVLNPYERPSMCSIYVNMCDYV